MQDYTGLHYIFTIYNILFSTMVNYNIKQLLDHNIKGNMLTEKLCNRHQVQACKEWLIWYGSLIGKAECPL